MLMGMKSISFPVEAIGRPRDFKGTNLLIRPPRLRLQRQIGIINSTQGSEENGGGTVRSQIRTTMEDLDAILGIEPEQEVTEAKAESSSQVIKRSWHRSEIQSCFLPAELGHSARDQVSGRGSIEDNRGVRQT